MFCYVNQPNIKLYINWSFIYFSAIYLIIENKKTGYITLIFSFCSLLFNLNTHPMIIFTNYFTILIIMVVFFPLPSRALAVIRTDFPAPAFLVVTTPFLLTVA